MNVKMCILSGKTEKFFTAARKEYEKRLSRFCKLKTKEYRNADKLLKDVEKDSTVIIVGNRGEQLSSTDLADKISSMELNGVSSMTLVIGAEGEEGIASLNNRHEFSISRMDMSAGLASAVALEQLYRAYKIMNGETYHK